MKIKDVSLVLNVRSDLIRSVSVVQDGMNEINIVKWKTPINLEWIFIVHYLGLHTHWESDGSECQTTIAQLENWWIQRFGYILEYVTDGN